MTDRKIPKLFGTDGIRGTANQYPMTPDTVAKIGQAISRHMVVHLTAYMGLFVPVFREPTLN